MPVFTPCIAVSKAKLSATKVANGQLIIVLESGEIYFDYNNRRIQLAKSTSSESTESGDNPFIFPIVNADTKASESLAAGNGGSSGGSDGGDGDSGDDDSGGDDSGDDDDTPTSSGSDEMPQPITPEFTESWPNYPIVHGNLSS